MKRTLSAIFFSLIVAAWLAATCPAQEPATNKPRAPRTAQKPELEAPQKAEPAVEVPTAEEQMRQTISTLSTQIDSLKAEIKLMRRATERNSLAMELLLTEERLARVEEKLDQATQNKVMLDAREADILRRQKNIQQEVTARGFLRRDEGEALLRTEFQRALDETRNQQQQAQQRVTELQTQVTQTRARVDTLSRRLERAEGREEDGDSKQ